VLYSDVRVLYYTFSVYRNISAQDRQDKIKEEIYLYLQPVSEAVMECELENKAFGIFSIPLEYNHRLSIILSRI
jgi:hypothetical protein